MDNKQDITQAATQIMCQALDADTSLIFGRAILPDDWGRNLVWQYRVTSAATDAPESVVIKVSKQGGGHIFNDWAGLAYLNGIDALRGLVPTLYGGDAQREMVVLEDMGDIRGTADLGSIMEGDNVDLARRALLANADAMAALHRHTTDHESDYASIRQQFPAFHPAASKDNHADHFEWFSTIMPSFGVDISEAVKAEGQQIIETLTAPDAPRAYTRGDVCPSNIAYADDRIRFYDLEMGAYRHVLLPATYFRLSHLTCVNGSLIPLDLQREAEQRYFAAIAPLLPAPDVVQMDYAAAIIARLVWLLSQYLEKKNRPRHLATRHQRMYAGLSLFLTDEALAEPYPHLTQSLRDLHHQLTQHWDSDDKNIPLFPAFSDSHGAG